MIRVADIAFVVAELIEEGTLDADLLDEISVRRLPLGVAMDLASIVTTDGTPTRFGITRTFCRLDEGHTRLAILASYNELLRRLELAGSA